MVRFGESLSKSLIILAVWLNTLLLSGCGVGIGEGLSLSSSRFEISADTDADGDLGGLEFNVELEQVAEGNDSDFALYYISNGVPVGNPIRENLSPVERLTLSIANPTSSSIGVGAYMNGQLSLISNQVQVFDVFSMAVDQSGRTMNLGYINGSIPASVDTSSITIEQGSQLTVGDPGAAKTIANSFVLVDSNASSSATTSITMTNIASGHWNVVQDPVHIMSTAAKALWDANASVYGTTIGYPGTVGAGYEGLSGNNTPMNITIGGPSGFYGSYLIIGSSEDDIFDVKTATALIEGLGGNDRFTQAAFKSTCRGGEGNDYFLGAQTWENRYYGDNGNDTLFFKTHATTQMTNSQNHMGDGNDCVFFASSTNGEVFASATLTFEQGNQVNLDGGNDLAVFDELDTNFGAGTKGVAISGGSGDDTILFAPEEIDYDVATSYVTITGGSGFDTYVYHGPITRNNGAGAYQGDLLSILGTTNFSASGFERISMGAVTGSSCSTTPGRTWNNSANVTLTLTEAQILSFASGNELGGATLYVVGDTDGSDRVNVSGYADTDACDVSGYNCYCAGTGCLLIQQGVYYSTDGFTYNP